MKISRHFPASFSALSLLIFGLFLLGLRADAQNFVQNGSFEQGMAHWSGISYSLDAKQHHWEEHCVRLGSAGRLAQTISGLTVGQTYYANLWCQGKSVGTKNQIAAGSHGQFRAALPAGTYRWTRVQLRFVADAPSLPLVIRVQGKTAALWVDDVYVTRDKCLDVRALGIKGDGKTDVTEALNAALTAHRFLFLPAGAYCLSAPITVPNDTILWGDGNATILKMQNPRVDALLTASGTDSAFAGNDEVTGIRFVGLQRQNEHLQQHALRFVKVNGLLVRHCSTKNCGLLLTETNEKVYRDVRSEADLSKNVRVAFNDAEASRQYPSPSTGIELRYTKDATAVKNTIRYFSHGIMWWGGNSDFGTDGAMTNPRWARRLVIAGNTVTDMSGGGIWGSMGQNVTVKDNTIAVCGDVGLDFEGCFDSVADSNTVADAHNGGLTSFFGVSNITFRRNKITTSNPEWPLFRLYNSSVDPKNVRQITLKGNEFRATSGIGVLDDHNGPGPLLITHNRFINVRIDISHHGSGFNVVGPTITDNSLTFTAASPSALAAVNVYFLFGDATIRRNSIRYYGAVNSDKVGIQVEEKLGQTGEISIVGNTIVGFGKADITVAAKTPGSTAVIDSNTVEHRSIIVTASSSLTVRGNGNKDLTGAFVDVTRLP